MLTSPIPFKDPGGVTSDPPNGRAKTMFSRLRPRINSSCACSEQYSASEHVSFYLSLVLTGHPLEISRSRGYSSYLHHKAEWNTWKAVVRRWRPSYVLLTSSSSRATLLLRLWMCGVLAKCQLRKQVQPVLSFSRYVKQSGPAAVCACCSIGYTRVCMHSAAHSNA